MLETTIVVSGAEGAAWVAAGAGAVPPPTSSWWVSSADEGCLSSSLGWGAAAGAGPAEAGRSSSRARSSDVGTEGLRSGLGCSRVPSSEVPGVADL